jgi:hypothetical protein
MEAVSETHEPAKQSSFFALVRNTSILVPVLSFLGYYAPYMVGLAYHERLLNQFDIPPGLFPSDTHQVFISAYQAILEVWADWSKFAIHSYVVPVSFFILGITFISWFALRVHKRKKFEASEPANRKPQSKWVQLPVLFLIFGIAVASLSVTLPIVLFPVLALPASLGQQGAQLVAERNIKLLAGGCGIENEKHIYCQAVVDKDKVIAVGFEIATSDTRIALYQPKQTKIVKLGDATIEVMPPEAFRVYQALLSKPEPSATPVTGAQP